MAWSNGVRRWSPMVLAFIAGTCGQEPASVSTSTDPGELFQSLVQAWNDHDYAAVDSLVASDAIEEIPARDFRGQGPEGFKGAMRQTLATIPDFAWNPTTVLVDSFKVAAEWTVSGRYTGNTPRGPVRGKRFTIRGVSIVITNGRRITRATDYYDLTELYRQVASPP
jgi:steroid delta-isomerase-like uncharacterized protein